MGVVTTADAEEQRFVDAISGARPRVREVLARLGAVSSDLDDLTQEVFARAWRYRESFDRHRPLEPWLSSIAIRVWADHRAAGARRPEMLGARDPQVRDRTAADAEARDQIVHALGKLTAIQREVLLAFHRDGVPLAEIARSRRMPVNTVKSHLHRARRALGEGSP
jgi:RNA polymerase sigma-70 factor (ECF subfamily)